MYVRNAWYVACSSDELKAAPLGRTICTERMVFFRGEGGSVSALEDFCPHRGAPLSLGSVREDGRIVCGYHGLVMGGDGRCVSMPTIDFHLPGQLCLFCGQNHPGNTRCGVIDAPLFRQGERTTTATGGAGRGPEGVPCA